jgi:hypothetical protein
MAIKKGRVWRIIAISLSVIFVCILGVIWYIINNMEKQARDFLINQVQERTNNLYSLDIGKIHVNFISKTIRVRNAELHADTLVFNQLKQQYDSPDLLYDINIESINMEVCNLMDIYRKKIFQFEEFTITKPNIIVFKQQKTKNQNDSLLKKDTIPILNADNILPTFLSGLTLKEINIEHGNYSYLVDHGFDSLYYSITDFTVNIKNLNIDSNFDISQHLPKYGHFGLQIKQIDYNIPNYTLHAKNIILNAENSLFHVDSLQVIPIYEQHNFAYKAKRPACANVLFLNLDIFKFNLQELIYKQTMYADSITLENLYVYSYKNDKVPPTPVVKPMFQEIVQQLPFALTIPLIKINNGHVTHRQLTKSAFKSGYITLDNIKGEIRDVTNIVDSNNQYFTAHVEAKFMRSAKMTAVMKLPVDPKNKIFTLNLQIKNLNLAEVNTILEPAAHLSIVSGVVSDMDFNMKGNNTKANINMLMKYNDLNVSILSKDNTHRRWLLSELANGLFVINDNPKNNQAERKIKTSVTRNPYYYQFNYIFIGVLQGAEQTVGFTAQRQEQVKRMMEKKQQKQHNKNNK